MLKWQRDNAIPLDRVRQRWSDAADMAKELEGKFLTGVFVNRESPEFVSGYYEMASRAAAERRNGKEAKS